MPIKTKNGKWKWGNVERSSKKELVQTVYGIWKKNGAKGSFSDFLKGTHESYEPPYTLDTIKQKYGNDVYRKLRNDPVHRFRAETGIEVIHKEPTRDEFERIVKNWDLMTPEQKKQSDEFSMKQFGNNNKNRIDLLRKEYDFNVGDKVKVRKGLRCFQSGHSGKIIEIEPPDKYGWSSFVIKFDEPRLGAMGFYSGDIEKINESVISEDKTNMIKKLILPDIENEQEKEQFKSNLIEWFKSNSSYETKIDWNKWKTLTKSDFEKLIKSKELSKNQQRHKERKGSGKDAKDLFKDINGRKFKIIDETDNWLFVAPLNYKATVFCDSKACGGGSAKWCIGYEKDDSFWNQYVGNGEKFIMIFNKNFETLPEKKLFTDLKYMVEYDSTEYEVKDQIKIWEQDDRDFSINYYDSKFEINSEDFKKLFDKIDEKEYVLERFSISGTILKDIRAIEFDHLIIPDGIKEVADFACKSDTKIYELTIPSSVEVIAQYAFSSAEMENIHIKEDSNLELIGREAFSYNNIETLDLSKLTKLRFIGDKAFSNNRSLEEAYLPISLNDMGYDVFDGCKSLRKLVIPEIFFDPENDYEVLKSICGDNIPWDDIEIFTIDENGIKEKRN